MLYDWISKVGFFLSSSYHNKTLHLPGLHCDHVLPFFFFFFSYFHLHEVHNSLNDQVNETYPPHPWKTLRKQYGDERQEARRPAVVDVVRAPVAWNPSLLNTVTFDPLSLCPLCLLIGASRWALWTEKKNYVSFPLSGVVVNIRLLVSLASSEGVRLDPPCAKKKTRKERKRF